MSTTSSKLSLGFHDASNNSFTLNYAYAKSDVSSSVVRALMNGIISNGDMFMTQPTTKTGAKLITTTTTDLDVEDE